VPKAPRRRTTRLYPPRRRAASPAARFLLRFPSTALLEIKISCRQLPRKKTHLQDLIWSYYKRMVAEIWLSKRYPDGTHESSGPANFELALKVSEVGVLPAPYAKKIEGDSVWPRRPLFD
jgi:hypothetical protein